MRQDLRRFLAAGPATLVAVVLGAGSVGGAGADADRGRAGARHAECRVVLTGSTATARCFNQSPYADAVQLHIECVYWWDPDVDGAPVTLDPAEGAQLSDRCWFGIRRAWVSHR